MEKVRVFIGSGNASLLERKALVYSLKENSKRDLDLYVFNGTHNAIEHNNEPPQLAPLSLRLKYQNFTEFSLYRYLIPEICGHDGKAIYLDSDMICLRDIGELFDASGSDYDFLAKSAYGQDEWATSVMLINCDCCRFDLEAIFDEIDQNAYSYTDFSQLSKTFLQHRAYRIGELDPHWNVFDRYDEDTKLIHYTDLRTQPWKHPGHPYGDLWFDYFNAARRDGFITDEDVRKSIWRGNARLNIEQGNDPLLPSLRQRLSRRIRGLLPGASE